MTANPPSDEHIVRRIKIEGQRLSQGSIDKSKSPMSLFQSIADWSARPLSIVPQSDRVFMPDREIWEERRSEQPSAPEINWG